MAKTKSAEEKKARNLEIARLYTKLSREKLALKYKMSLGGLSALIARLKEKGLIKTTGNGKKKVRTEEIKKSEKVEIKKPRIEEIKKGRKEGASRVGRGKKKVGYILPGETIRALDLYRADHRDRSLSEIVNSAILEFLKRR
jgi:hypothetical protein